MAMVVILKENNPAKCKLSFRELIEKHRFFFHPVDVNGWPKKPPNYIAFFIGDELLSMHHVESYEVFNDPNDVIAEIESQIWETHYFYSLGKPIEPQSKISLVKENKQIEWCMIDTLLTSESLDEALIITKNRLDSAKY